MLGAVLQTKGGPSVALTTGLFNHCGSHELFQRDQFSGLANYMWRDCSANPNAALTNPTAASTSRSTSDAGTRKTR